METPPRSSPPQVRGSGRDLPLRPRKDSLEKPLPPLPPSSPSDVEEVEEEHVEQPKLAAPQASRFAPPMLSPERMESPPPMIDRTFGPPLYRPVPGRPQMGSRTDSEGSDSGPTTPINRLAGLTIETRNRSPFARTHLRTNSSHSTASSPGLAPRSKSLPYGELGRPASPLLRPASPYSASGRRVSPLRRPFEDSYSFSGVDIDQTISENSELQLDLKPRPMLTIDSNDSNCTTPTTPSSPYTAYGTFPRTRRRPSSPLHVLHSPGYSRLHASASSPALRSPGPSPIDPAKYNESFPSPVTGGGAIERGPPTLQHANTISTGPPYATSTFSGASGSSMPSTPSSFRSRSPSISSLETIPDSPDAEAAAAAQTERDRNALARLRAAAEKRNDGSHVRGRTMGRTSDGTGPGGSGSSAKERKRWSVCGAERRGDLEMETIWED